MKWERPKEGTIRTVRKFLWLPLEIDNKKRWLEWATIEEQAIYFIHPMSGHDLGWGWVPVRWTDNLPTG